MLARLQVVYDSYQLSGFPFFPALPWKAMPVPPQVPHPAKLMMAGFFEFGGVDVRFWSFVLSAAAVPIAFVLYALTMPNGCLVDAERNLKVVEIFFDTLLFSATKTLTGVFACTSVSISVQGEDGEPRAFCQLEHESDGSAVATTTSEQPEMCMDIDPTTACWGQHHRAYVLVAMAVLVPYYYAALTFQLDAQVRLRFLSCRIVDISLWTLRELSTLAKSSITIARVLTLELRVHRRANP